MICTESANRRIRCKVGLIVSVLVIAGLTIVGCTPPTIDKVPVQATHGSLTDASGEHLGPSAVALRFLDAMLRRDLATMKALMVPDRARLAESAGVDLRTGHGANPSTAEPPTLDPSTALQEDDRARYDAMVGLFYGNDIYRYRIQVELQRTSSDVWLVSDVQVSRVQQ